MEAREQKPLGGDEMERKKSKEEKTKTPSPEALAEFVRIVSERMERHKHGCGM